MAIGNTFAYLTLFYVGNEIALNDPANTGGVIGHHWTLGFWVVWLALAGEMGIGLPSRSAGAQRSRAALRAVCVALWALAGACVLLRVAPIPAEHADTLNRLCVLGAMLFGVPAVFLTSLSALRRANGRVARLWKSEVSPIRIVGESRPPKGSEHTPHIPAVYTYSAPGLPPCLVCGRNPTIFHHVADRLRLRGTASPPLACRPRRASRANPGHRGGSE